MLRRENGGFEAVLAMKQQEVVDDGLRRRNFRAEQFMRNNTGLTLKEAHVVRMPAERVGEGRDHQSAAVHAPDELIRQNAWKI